MSLDDVTLTIDFSLLKFYRICFNRFISETKSLFHCPFVFIIVSIRVFIFHRYMIDSVCRAQQTLLLRKMVTNVINISRGSRNKTDHYRFHFQKKKKINNTLLYYQNTSMSSFTIRIFALIQKRKRQIGCIAEMHTLLDLRARERPQQARWSWRDCPCGAATPGCWPQEVRYRLSDNTSPSA